MRLLCLILNISLISAYTHYSENEALNTLYRWKQIDFEYSSEQEKLAAIANGEFIQANVIPLGIERWKNRVFISTPRWKKGTPATLSSLPVTASNESPPLKPFPSWDYHNAANCTGLTSVFRMSVDHCGVMWVLDSGIIEAFEIAQQICPPTLIAIDLETDTVLGRYPIPDKFVLQNSLITNILVDSRDPTCSDNYVYIADAWRFGLIVFRKSDEAFWRFDHFTFFPEPLLSNYTLHGVNYQTTDGIFGMSLGKIESGDRPLYYHSMSSTLQFVVRTSIIRDPARITNAVNEFRLVGERIGLDSQLSAAAIDRSGIMFYSLISRDSIGCWNTSTDYVDNNLGVAAKSNKILVFPNDLRIDQETPQFVWIISNRLPMYQFNLIDPNEYNYRVLYLDPVKAIENTVCQSHL